MSTAEGGQQVSRPLQIILGVVIAAAALFALWTFVLSPLLGGDDDAATGPVTPPPAAGQATDDPVEALTPVPEDGDPLADAIVGQPVPETFEIFTARDPFQQLVVQSGTVAAAAVEQANATDDATPEPTATPTTSATTGSSTSSSSSSSGSTTTDSPDTPEITDSEAPEPDEGVSTQGGGAGEIYEPTPSQAGNTEITLASVTTTGPVESLTVSVNQGDHTVSEGEVFADRFQLLDIDGRCAIFLFGDSRFTLCEGDTIVK